MGSEQPEGSGPEATLGPTFSGSSLQFGSINAFSCRHASQSETGGRAGYREDQPSAEKNDSEMKEVFTMEDMKKWMIAVEQAQPSEVKKKKKK